jgi:hypothetical protein
MRMPNMNRYSAMAQSHWARWLPQRYAAIKDPNSFFSTLGQETARQIDELAAELAGDDRPGEGYPEKAGRLTAARSQAEEIILPQQVLLAPEPEASEDPEESDLPMVSGERPMVIDRSHPLWAEVNAEQEELARDS